MAPRKITVVGAGPAGLAAAEALLDLGRGAVSVRMATIGHLLGGKAASWRAPDGRVVEHGQHIMVGFYEQLRGLLRRSGVDARATSWSPQGHFLIYEDRDDRVHHLYLGPNTPRVLIEGLLYSGFTLAEKAAFLGFFARAAPAIIGGVSPSHDDICFTAWCLKRGLPPSFVGTNAWRAMTEVYMNWPREVSAYALLRTVRLSARDFSTSEVRFPAGGMSELWWGPIAQRIEALGGQLVRRQKLVGLAHDDQRLSGLVFASPVPHPPDDPYSNRSVPTLEGSARTEACDAAIVTVPASEMALIVSADPGLAALPGLGNVPRLCSVSPLALQVWHRAPVTNRRRSVVGGLAPPLGFVVDNKPIYPEYRDDEHFGSVLHFAGQETAFEHLSDDEILAGALASVRRVPGYEAIDRAGVLDWCVLRHRGPHKQYWDAEPGSLRFKPPSRTALRGLYLAGDWVRSSIDIPCMEGAVRSGREAARLVLADLGVRR